MNNHHPPPPPPPSSGLDSHTVAQVLKKTTSIFFSHLLTFLFVSFLLVTFRCNVENGTHLLTDFIDKDPSLRPLLSRLDPSGSTNPSSGSSAAAPHSHHRRRPFLHLTRVGTLDEDFFSGDEDTGRRSVFGYHPKPPPNGTFLILSNSRLGFSNYVSDNGIKVSEIGKLDLSLKLLEGSLQSIDDASNTSNYKSQGEDEAERVVDLGFLIKGLELRRGDASSLFLLVLLLSTAYGYALIGFLVTYSWVLGIVFVVVLNHFLGRYGSGIGTIWGGSILGIKRASGFVLMRWAVRDALSQLLGLWFFSEVDDQYLFFKIFLRLKLMPFSLTNQWVRGFEKETAGFLFAWILSDMFLEFVFAVDSWVAIVDSRRSGREIVKEGCYLLSTMFRQAGIMKSLEFMLCGSFTRWTLARYFGMLFATAFQSIIEVYFMVAWLIFYLAVRCKDATSLGRTFGQRELEGFIQGNI